MTGQPKTLKDIIDQLAREELAKITQGASEGDKKDEALQEVARTLPAVIMMGTMLFKAHRARRRGDWDAALFYAILWAGYSNNVNLQTVIRRLEGRK